MKALLKTAKGSGNLIFVDRPVPELPAEDWVLIKVKAAGVCGTDLHIWKDEFMYWPPVILGHEFSGEIVKTGTAVKNFAFGDRVVAEPHSLACGVCEMCRQGHIQVCRSKRSPGWGIDGAFAEYLTMPAHLLHRIPDSVPDDLAALSEPLAIVIHQVCERGRVEFRDTVAVTGTGLIGLLAVFTARISGAGKIFVTGLPSCENQRFPAAQLLGADRIINVQKEDPVQVVLEETGGRGADLVVETSGAAPAIAQGLEILRLKGRFSAIGLTASETVPFPWNRSMLKGIDLFFNMSSSYTSWNRALSLLEARGKDLLPLITHRSSLEDWEVVFEDLVREKGIKALFIP
jgi:L-iditol 2-dehydrogenase